MKIHEFQAKEIFRQAGLPVLAGRVATTPEEAVEAHAELGGEVSVVKAQIHAGGRGKGGGVKVCRGASEVQAAAEAILGKALVTHQTGPEGTTVRRVYVEAGCDIATELYAACVLDRERHSVVVIASSEGGVEIEEVARTNPEAIRRELVDRERGLDPFRARRLAFGLGLSGKTALAAASLFARMAQVFLQKDATLVEINPLVVTKAGEVLALDAKINFDDNALWRHPELHPLEDPYEKDPGEVEAARQNLSYIRLDGSIGCMVNGAGLAMATMDIIKHYGSMPANFLDVGGAATPDRVTAAFRIILRDPNVKAILVNIFGGIVRCDVIAQGIVEATKAAKISVPVVVRLEGTNMAQGREILESSGLGVEFVQGMAAAAERSVALSKAGAA